MANKWFTRLVVAGLLTNMAPVQAEQGHWVVRDLANSDQAGMYFELSDKWLVNFETRVSDIGLPVRVAGNPVARSNINPVMTALKLGYQF